MVTKIVQFHSVMNFSQDFISVQNFTPHKSDNSSIGKLIFILDQIETTKNGMATKMLRKGPKNDLLQILIFHNPFIYTT